MLFRLLCIVGVPINGSRKPSAASYKYILLPEVVSF